MSRLYKKAIQGKILLFDYDKQTRTLTVYNTNNLIMAMYDGQAVCDAFMSSLGIKQWHLTMYDLGRICDLEVPPHIEFVTNNPAFEYIRDCETHWELACAGQCWHGDRLSELWALAYRVVRGLENDSQ